MFTAIHGNQEYVTFTTASSVRPMVAENGAYNRAGIYAQSPLDWMSVLQVNKVFFLEKLAQFMTSIKPLESHADVLINSPRP